MDIRGSGFFGCTKYRTCTPNSISFAVQTFAGTQVRNFSFAKRDIDKSIFIQIKRAAEAALIIQSVRIDLEIRIVVSLALSDREVHPLTGAQVPFSGEPPLVRKPNTGTE